MRGRYYEQINCKICGKVFNRKPREKNGKIARSKFIIIKKMGAVHCSKECSHMRYANAGIKTDICCRCGKEYKFRKRKGLKYKACRKCTMYIKNLERRKKATNNGICIQCFKRKVRAIKCPHCKKPIIKSVRCNTCMKDNGVWALRHKRCVKEQQEVLE